MATEVSESPTVNPAVRWFMNNVVRNPMRVLGLALMVYLAFLAYRNVATGEYTANQFISQLITGTAQGSIYALIALGYTLVYGILFMINFAHGEVFMVGAYVSFFVINAFDATGYLAEQTALALLFTLLSGIAASIVVAFLLERIAYRPLRSAPRLVPLITAIGASITLQQLAQRLFGASVRSYPIVNFYIPWPFADLECEMLDTGEEICRGLDLVNGRYPVDILGATVRLRPMYFVVFFVALLLMGVLWFVIQRTKMGRAMRAVAEDKQAAALMGVNVDTVIVTTFVWGAALAGAGSVLFSLYNRQVSPFMGFQPGIKAFTAAVLGGIGNIPGAMAGGLVLGILESVGPSLIGLPNQLKDVISFGILVLILVFRPTGIFGEALTEKKA